MDLTPEQKQAVASWVAAGDNLSAVQTKLREQFKISMTYMDVRFLVDDLNLQLHDPTPPPPATAIGKEPAGTNGKAGEKKGFFDKVKQKVGLGAKEAADDLDADIAEEEDLAEEDLAEEDADSAPGGVKIGVDNVTLIPGAVASGTVTFSDGVTGKWIVDQYGRPGFTEIGKPGYRPSAADAQAFVRELGRALQKRGY